MEKGNAMANEKRLIDANRALEIVHEQGIAHPNAYHLTNYATLILREAPTVDAVEVVRCRECVGRPFWEEDHNGVPVCLLSGLYVRSEDDFCSYGERKDGDGNG